ncbi:MAG: hypothetical protein AAGU27_22415 [Dehalobacterium sp.]
MKIASEIPIPELQPCSGIPNVRITIGNVPKEIIGAIESHAYYQAGKNQLLFHIKNVGSYYIANGKEIIIDSAPNAEIRVIRLFLLGSAMGVILFQRGIFPIHGSAVAVNEYCFITTGIRGSGKSTLAAAFKERGYSVLTDDIAAVAFDQEGVPWVYPSYPQQKLWKDSLASMGHEVSSLSSIYGRIDKYAVPIKDQFCEIPKKLAGIYEVRKENCQNVSLNRLSGMDRLATIMNNIYRWTFVHGLNLNEAAFRYSAALAKQVSVSRIIRPDGVFSVEDQANLIESDLPKRK